MRFVSVTERPEGALESIIKLIPPVDHNGVMASQEEKDFITELMEQTTPNIKIELASHEELFLVIDSKIGFSISRCLPDQTVFNLGSYLKLLAPAQSAFTYWVVMDRKRTDSVSIKELMSADRVACVRNGRPVCDVFTDAEVKVGTP